MGRARAQSVFANSQRHDPSEEAGAEADGGSLFVKKRGGSQDCPEASSYRPRLHSSRSARVRKSLAPLTIDPEHAPPASAKDPAAEEEQQAGASAGMSEEQRPTKALEAVHVLSKPPANTHQVPLFPRFATNPVHSPRSSSRKTSVSSGAGESAADLRRLRSKSARTRSSNKRSSLFVHNSTDPSASELVHRNPSSFPARMSPPKHLQAATPAGSPRVFSIPLMTTSSFASWESDDSSTASEGAPEPTHQEESKASDVVVGICDPHSAPVPGASLPIVVDLPPANKNVISTGAERSKDDASAGSMKSDKGNKSSFLSRCNYAFKRGCSKMEKLWICTYSEQQPVGVQD